MPSYFKRTKNGRNLRQIDAFEMGCWIEVVNPTLEELGELGNNLRLNVDILAEGLDENELPRIDFEDGQTYIFVKALIGENKLGTVLIIITPEFILTLSKDEISAFKKIKEEKVEFITTQKYKCLITILSLLNDHAEQVVTKIIKNVQKKKNIADTLKEQDIENFLHEEDFLNNLVSAYYYMSLLYSKMIRKIKFFEEDEQSIRDLIIESDQGLNICRAALKTISNIRHYYSIILSHKLNRTFKIFTIATVMISIAAAVSSLFGMNVKLPFQDNSLAFIFVLLIIAAIMVGFIYYFKKKDIL